MAKFKPGESGNPNGRPKGKSAGAMVRTEIEARRQDVLNVVIDAAINGDMQACKMLLDRIAPTLRPVAASVELEIGNDMSLSEQAAQVAQAAFNGNIAPDTANTLMSVLSSRAKIIETSELISRIEALEQRSNG